MKRRLSQFCTLKQNQLPLACLGVEGEGSTQKPCNYSALAQQQRAKRASKAFLWAKQGSLRGKVQPVCEYQCMDLWASLETHRGKGCMLVSVLELHHISTLITLQYTVPRQYFKWQFMKFALRKVNLWELRLMFSHVKYDKMSPNHMQLLIKHM